MDPATLCKLLLIINFINSGLLNKEGNDKIAVWYDGTELERNSWLVSMLLHCGSGSRKLVLRSKSIKVSLCSSGVEIRAFRPLETWGTNSSVTRCLVHYQKERRSQLHYCYSITFRKAHLTLTHHFVNKAKMVRSFFGRTCAQHQEKQLYLCDTWYLLFSMDDCLVVHQVGFIYKIIQGNMVKKT